MEERNVARIQAETYRNRGVFYFDSRQYEKALAEHEKAIQADPTFLRAYAAKAITLRALDRNADAMEVAEEIIRRDPSYAFGYVARASALAAFGRHDEVVRDYEKAISLAPDDPMPYFNFACYWALLHDEDNTRRNLELAVDADPRYNTRVATDPDFEQYRDREWLRDLAAFRVEKTPEVEDSVTTEKLSTRADAPAPDASVRLQAEGSFHRGVYWFRRQRYQEALAAHDQAIEMDPTFLRAYVAKSITLRHLDRLDEALELANEIVARDPSYPLGYLALAAGLERKGDWENSRLAYEKGLELDPGESILHYNYACYWAHRGDEEHVKERLAKAIDLDPQLKSFSVTDPDLAAYREKSWFLDLTSFTG
ncbi:MAG: tetratricopeptide repeat protein [Candidatus Zixiibacteriota bacterium]|jgi:tetratricopeptide (TPR) repeat protein